MNHEEVIKRFIAGTASGVCLVLGWTSMGFVKGQDASRK